MYFIIETEDQLARLPTEDTCFMQVIPSNDHQHPKLAKPSLIYYRLSTKGYILVLNHYEGYSLSIDSVYKFLSKQKTIYVLDAKYHSYFLDLNNYVDINFTQLDKVNEVIDFQCDTNLHRDFNYRINGPVNYIIPISKHYQKCECLYEGISQHISPEIDVIGQKELITAYKKVEEVGIAINEDKLLELYEIKHKDYSISGNKIYTSYNLYNLTGRPTNSFNNINFLAIPKEEAYRSCFVPNNDYFVDFDFDAYHLRLIGDLINYSLPKESLHNYFGKLYFKKDTLTPEEYDESKKISFKQLYGGVDKKYKHIDFFNHLDQFIESKWNSYTKDGYIILPTGRVLRQLRGMNSTKLFNYIIQNLETKQNVKKINDIHNLVESQGYKSRIVLVTYDSLLLDYALEDGKQALIDIKAILESGGMMVKHKYGKSYYFSIKS